MAETARLFQDRRAEDLILSSPDPSAHKRTGHVDNAVWDRVREYAALAGNFAKISQSPTMKPHLQSIGTNCFGWSQPF